MNEFQFGPMFYFQFTDLHNIGEMSVMLTIFFFLNFQQNVVLMILSECSHIVFDFSGQ